MTEFFYILLAIAILLLMVVIHELGHYVAGKILKFKINEFSVGFGPLLFSKENKKTGEKFSLRLIPLGGYCAFEDEQGLDAEERSNASESVGEVFEELEQKSVMPPAVDPLNPPVETRSFVEEAPWKRLIVLVAGALFNFLSAIIFSIIVILLVGYSIPTVSTVYQSTGDNPAYYSSLEAGDKILGVNGERISIMRSYEEMVTDKTEGKEYDLIVLRNGEEISVKVKVQRIQTVYEGEELDYLGVGFVTMYESVSCSFLDALVYCVPYTCKLSLSILAAFGGLFTGSTPITSMTGPIGTVGAMAEISMLNWRNILILLPLIASNLAIFNILPIPALDGSKIIFTAIEWIRGKPLNRNVENIIHTVGMLLLFGFVILIDLIGIFT